MIEYMESIINGLQLKYLIVNDTNKYPYNDNDIYIFIQKIPDKLLLRQNNDNILLLNTEQYTRDHIKKYLTDIMNKNIKIIDYSPENIKCFNNDTNIKYLPYQYNDVEINKLKHLFLTTNKKYDVVFIGCILPKSPRRKKIYDELEKRGIKMLNIYGKWNNARDIDTYSAKILLNIHHADDYNIYESLRCDRLIFSGMMVISEKSINTNLLDINELIIFESYDKLVDTVIDVINNYDSYFETFISKYNQTIDNIKNERLGHLTHLNYILNNKTEY